jgi:hypothetical protein
MSAACGGRQLAADELLQAKLLLPLNCQMFVQGAENQLLLPLNCQMFVQGALLQQQLSSLKALNRQRFVLGFDAVFPLVPLNIFACGQSASSVSERGPSQVPFQQAMV